METPLPAAIAGMRDGLASWANDAQLTPCLNYVLVSKYLEIPEVYKELM